MKLLRRRPSTWRRTVALGALLTTLLAAAAFGGWLWLKQSSLVSVDADQVVVRGARGPSANLIRNALRDAATGMSTLDLDERGLLQAVAAFPQVRRVEAEARGHTGVQIRVIQHTPIGSVELDGRDVPVAGDGTVLRGVRVERSLPRLSGERGAIGGARLRGHALRAVEALDAAPRSLRSHVLRVRDDGAHGLVVTLRQGPELRFGTSARVAVKWAAAARVLADPEARGARYIDLRAPDRPAAGGVSNPTPASSAAAEEEAAAAEDAAAYESSDEEDSSFQSDEG